MDVRGKLVELIEQSGACFNCFPVAGYEKDEIEKIASHLIAHGVTVQEWISVKDRLPEEMDKVLANVCGVIITAVLKNGVWLSSWNHDVVNDEVTHWCCLPQPPKGE